MEGEKGGEGHTMLLQKGCILHTPRQCMSLGVRSVHHTCVIPSGTYGIDTRHSVSTLL